MMCGISWQVVNMTYSVTHVGQKLATNNVLSWHVMTCWWQFQLRSLSQLLVWVDSVWPFRVTGISGITTIGHNPGCPTRNRSAVSGSLSPFTGARTRTYSLRFLFLPLVGNLGAMSLMCHKMSVLLVNFKKCVFVVQHTQKAESHVKNASTGSVTGTDCQATCISSSKIIPGTFANLFCRFQHRKFVSNFDVWKCNFFINS